MSESGDYHVMNCETDDGTVVYVRGEIDLTTHDTLVRMLDQAAARGQNVIVDLSRTTFMDSSGVRALMELWHSQTAAGLDLVVRNPSDPLLRTLHYAGLDRVFRIDRRSQSRS
jgi:anti-sigma B factor antagonist